MERILWLRHHLWFHPNRFLKGLTDFYAKVLGFALIDRPLSSILMGHGKCEDD